MTSHAMVQQSAAVAARATIAHHSRSFAMASALLGTRVRDETAVVYTWCRRADDAVDNARSADDARAALARLRRELDEVYAGTARDPVLAAFGTVVAERAIPRAYPAALLDGMEMDVVGTRYATLDELLLYCWRVAGVVGLMMTHVFGVSSNRALRHAGHLGIAMQLTNICRDIAEDWQRGRLYLPARSLAQRGTALVGTVGGAFPQAAAPAIKDVVRELLAVADRYYRSGDRGIAYLAARPALAVRAARAMYSAIGGRIARAGFDPTRGRAVVSGLRKLAISVRAIGSLAWSAPLRLISALTGRRTRVPTLTLEAGDVTSL